MILGYRENPLKVDGKEGDDLGWDWHARSYIFRPIEESKPGMIATAAMMLCDSCRTVIKSMGGPGNRCYCVNCYEQLKIADFAQGHEHSIVALPKK